MVRVLVAEHVNNIWHYKKMTHEDREHIAKIYCSVPTGPIADQKTDKLLPKIKGDDTRRINRAINEWLKFYPNAHIKTLDLTEFDF